MIARFELADVADDGLPTLDIGNWALEKYRLVGIYASLFATSMKDRWDRRVYIDLFAGPGRSTVRGTSRIVPASPLIAASVADPFDCYICCERNPASSSALRERFSRDHPGLDVTVLEGDANDLVPDIIRAMPPFGKGSKVLAFCFADPFRVSGLKFATIQGLSERFMDFLILIPTGMDASRNWEKQFDTDEKTALDDFFGTDTWRKEWERVCPTGRTFDGFMTEFFSNRMGTIGYSHGGFDSSVLIRNPDKNQRLYRLGFFSKHPLGAAFWKEAVKYSSPQQDMF